MRNSISRWFLAFLVNFWPKLYSQRKAASMYFWSVSWSTNCPVYFSFFLVDQFFFWLTKNKFGRPKKKLVDQKHEKMVFGWPKKKLVDQKNEKLVFGRPKKKLVDQKNVKLTGQLVDQRDWPKVHGRRYSLWRRRFLYCDLATIFFFLISNL